MQIREEIKIFWEGPFKIDDILDGKIDNKKYDVKTNDKGLYQIYGSHPLYGDNVLVYIGRTKSKGGFGSRLKDRWVVNHGSDTENVQIYLGTVFSDGVHPTDDQINNIIDKTEILLINAMKPAYNSSNIQSANEDFIDDNFILHNQGNYRNLFPVLDSKYFWQPYKNFAIINELAESYNIKKIKGEEDYYGFIIDEIGTFEIPDDYSLWFGVEYEEWNKSKIPLELQLIPKNENITEQIKSLQIKELKYIELDHKEEENYFQIEFSNDFFELEFNNLKEAFEIKVNTTINLIKL